MKFPEIHSAQAIANTFILKSHQDNMPISHLKLQKLIFIAYGYSLVAKNKSLTHDGFHIGEYGPYSQSVFKDFSSCKNQPITKLATQLSLNTTPDFKGEKTIRCVVPPLHKEDPANKIIDFVWDTYKSWTTLELSDLANQEKSAWNFAIKNNYKIDQKIPDSLIHTQFKNFVKIPERTKTKNNTTLER